MQATALSRVIARSGTCARNAIINNMVAFLVGIVKNELLSRPHPPLRVTKSLISSFLAVSCMHAHTQQDTWLDGVRSGEVTVMKVIIATRASKDRGGQDELMSRARQGVGIHQAHQTRMCLFRCTHS